jgi:glycosyltransferase involved in cell wall biosynthesis
MNIVLAVTTYNEIAHVNLQLDNALEMGCYSEIVVLDDGSSDGTWDVLKQYAKKHNNIHVYRNEVNSVINKGKNRWAQISELVKPYAPTWVNNRACDIIYPANNSDIFVSQLKKFSEMPVYKVAIPFVNLWRSEGWYRSDGVWGQWANSHQMVVMWKYDKNFKWKDKHLSAGMHRGFAIPSSINPKKMVSLNSGIDRPWPLPGLHFDMSTHDKLVKRFREMMALAEAGNAVLMPPARNMPSVSSWSGFNGYKVFYEFNAQFMACPSLWGLPVVSKKPKIESLYDVIKDYNKQRAEEYKRLYERRYGNN